MSADNTPALPDDAGTNAPAEPTSADVAAMQQSIADLSHTIKSMGGRVEAYHKESAGRLDAMSAAPKADEATPPTDGADTPEMVEMRRRLKESEDRTLSTNDKYLRRESMSQMERALADQGADSPLLQAYIRDQVSSLGNRVIVEDHDFGVKVSVKDDIGTPVPVAEWAGTIMETASGKALRTSKNHPQNGDIPRSGSTNPNAPEYTAEEFGRMTNEQLAGISSGSTPARAKS